MYMNSCRSWKLIGHILMKRLNNLADWWKKWDFYLLFRLAVLRILARLVISILVETSNLTSIYFHKIFLLCSQSHDTFVFRNIIPARHTYLDGGYDIRHTNSDNSVPRINYWAKLSSFVNSFVTRHKQFRR